MRLFVAVWPSDEVVEAVADVVAEIVAAASPGSLLDGIRWTKPEQWHVTLRFLGNVGEDEVAALEEAVGGVASRHEPVRAVVGPAVGNFGRNVLHVPVSGLTALADDTVTSTASIGVPPDDRPFAGHLTLARAGRGRRGDVRSFAGAGIDGAWTVDELTLVRSTTTRDGASYDVVARWPLG